MPATAMQTLQRAGTRQPARKLDLLLFSGFIALIMFAPLAFGAVEDWAIFAQECAAAGLLVTWSVQFIKEQNSPSLQPSPLYAPMAILAAMVAAQLVLRTSAYWYATLAGALQCCAFFIIFFLANQLLGDPKRLRQFVKVLTIFGFLLAALSMVLGLAAPEKLFGIRATANTSGMYGPYVNHAHYAGLMEMLAPFPLVMGLRRSLPNQQRMLWAVAGFFMAASIFLSDSRGGMLAFSFELLLVLGLFLARHRGRSTQLGAGFALALFAGFVIWFGSGNWFERLGEFRHPEIANKVRLEIARDTLHMFAARPMLGWGLGNFELAYPQFRSFYTNDVVNAAHNDYLQFLAELGLVGFCAILWFLFLVYQRGIGGIQESEPASNSGLRLAALVGISGIVLHSFIDFNLQVPANAALFFVLCAIACGGNTQATGLAKLKLQKTAFILVSVLACVYLLLCIRGFASAWLAHSWDESRLHRAAQLAPENAEPWARLGHLSYVEQDPITAAADLQNAVRRNPYDSRSWLELAAAAEFIGDRERQHHALEMAVKCNPTAPAVLITAAQLYLSGGDEQNGLHLLRVVSEHNHELLPEVLELAWRATHDSASIVREIAPDDPEAQIALLNVLTLSGRQEDAAQVWSAMSKPRHSYDARLIFPYIQYLIENNQGEQAISVWQDLGQIDTSLSAYQPSANLIVNAGFEEEILNAGLDWRYIPVGNVSLALDSAQAHGGRRSLSLSFDGGTNDAGIFQFVPLRPSTDYTLSGFYKIEQMQGAGGVQFEIADTATHSALNPGVLLNETGGWRTFSEDFKTGAATQIVKLRLVRVPSGDILQGKIWIDDLRLSRK